MFEPAARAQDPPGDAEALLDLRPQRCSPLRELDATMVGQLPKEHRRGIPDRIGVRQQHGAIRDPQRSLLRCSAVGPREETARQQEAPPVQLRCGEILVAFEPGELLRRA